MSKKTIIICWILLTAFYLSGCESEVDDDLEHYILEVKLRKARPIPPIPEFKPLATFVFPENDARRSPFKPKEEKKEEDKFAPNTHRVKQPLEQFPLDSLKFVGVLKQGNIIWGLISQPNGEITRVKVGNYMGQNFGKILQITNTSLKIEETLKAEGKWVKKITIFNLNANESGG